MVTIVARRCVESVDEVDSMIKIAGWNCYLSTSKHLAYKQKIWSWDSVIRHILYILIGAMKNNQPTTSIRKNAVVVVLL